MRLVQCIVVWLYMMISVLFGADYELTGRSARPAPRPAAARNPPQPGASLCIYNIDIYDLVHKSFSLMKPLVSFISWFLNFSF